MKVFLHLHCTCEHHKISIGAVVIYTCTVNETGGLHADMPSLASSASSGSEDSNEDDVTEADLPPSEYADGSDSDDGMPALVADDSDSGAAHAQHQPEHSMTVDFLGHGEASMLADLLQPQLQAAGFRDIDDINDVGRDSGWDDVLPDDAGELLDDTSMPPLIDLTSPGRLNTLASGRNTPLELDEQDRIDALEGALENGRDCFLRINQVHILLAGSVAVQWVALCIILPGCIGLYDWQLVRYGALSMQLLLLMSTVCCSAACRVDKAVYCHRALIFCIAFAVIVKQVLMCPIFSGHSHFFINESNACQYRTSTRPVS